MASKVPVPKNYLITRTTAGGFTPDDCRKIVRGIKQEEGKLSVLFTYIVSVLLIIFVLWAMYRMIAGG